jgi:hypothetical protein
MILHVLYYNYVILGLFAFPKDRSAATLLKPDEAEYYATLAWSR